MAHYEDFLEQYPPGSVIGQLLRTPVGDIYFKYGSIFPDCQFMNRLRLPLEEIYFEVGERDYVAGLTYEIAMDEIPLEEFPFGLDTHHPVHAFEFAAFLVQQAFLATPPGTLDVGLWLTERRAFALGYLAHLVQDNVAHNFLVAGSIAQTDLAALGIVRVEDLLEIPGQSESAIETMLDFRLGIAQCQEVVRVAHDEVWVRSPQYEPFYAFVDMPTGLYNGLNPVLDFYYECLQSWYSLHPEQFVRSPISKLGLSQCATLFKFSNMFYSELAGHGDFAEQYGHWIATHIQLENWITYFPVEFLGWWKERFVHFFVLARWRSAIFKEAWSPMATGGESDAIAARVRGDAIQASKTFFGLDNYDPVGTGNIVANTPALSPSEYLTYRQSPVVQDPQFLLGPFEDVFKGLSMEIYAEIEPEIAGGTLSSGWWTNWAPRNERSLRWAVLSSLARGAELGSQLNSFPALAVYDLSFHIDGDRVVGPLSAFDVSSDQLVCNAELYWTQPREEGATIQLLVRDAYGNALAAEEVFLQAPLFTGIGLESRSTVSLTVDLSSLVPSRNKLFAELRVSGESLPFVTNRWTSYEASPRVDVSANPVYALFGNFDYYPHAFHMSEWRTDHPSKMQLYSPTWQYSPLIDNVQPLVPFEALLTLELLEEPSTVPSLNAFEAIVEFPPEIAVLARQLLPPDAVNVGGGDNLIVGFPPLPYGGPISLVRYTLMTWAPIDTVHAVVRAASPSSVSLPGYGPVPAWVLAPGGIVPVVPEWATATTLITSSPRSEYDVEDPRVLAAFVDRDARTRIIVAFSEAIEVDCPQLSCYCFSVTYSQGGLSLGACPIAATAVGSRLALDFAAPFDLTAEDIELEKVTVVHDASGNHVPYGSVSVANPSSSGDLLISEVMIAPLELSGGCGKWLEIYNNGSQAVDLRDWSLGIGERASFVVSSSTPVLVHPQRYVIVGCEWHEMGAMGVPIVAEFPDLDTLSPESDSVWIKDPGGQLVDGVLWSAAGGWSTETLWFNPDAPAGESREYGASIQWDFAGAREAPSSWFQFSDEYGAREMGSPGRQNRSRAVGAPPSLSGPMVRVSSPSPNPFNPRTQFTVGLSQPGPLRVEIFDSRGRSVFRVNHAATEAGDHVFLWNGEDGSGMGVATGVYYVRASQHEHVATTKLLLLK